jgi:hypothetical protein
MDIGRLHAGQTGLFTCSVSPSCASATPASHEDSSRHSLTQKRTRSRQHSTETNNSSRALKAYVARMQHRRPLVVQKRRRRIDIKFDIRLYGHTCLLVSGVAISNGLFRLQEPTGKLGESKRRQGCNAPFTCVLLQSKWERPLRTLPATLFCALMAGTLVGSAPQAFACNGNGNCENAPGHNKVGAPGPIAGAGLPMLAIGYGVYWLIKRRRKTD